MKKFTIVSIFMLLQISCSTNNAIETNSIQIERIEQHPFLVDHCKQLSIYNREGALVDELKLYCDPGVGCKSYLFDTDKTFTVIDCNGAWYSVNKMTGKIRKEGWKWQEDMPVTYIGTFVRNEANKSYTLIKEQSITKRDVYQFKDPGE